jgi:hypothetical protein
LRNVSTGGERKDLTREGMRTAQLDKEEETKTEDVISVEILIIGLMTVLTTMALESVKVDVLDVDLKHILFRIAQIKISSPN